MKKLLLSVLICLSIFNLKAQIPGINWYQSNGIYSAWDDGVTLYWDASDCFSDFLTIELDQTDEYFIERDGVIEISLGSTNLVSIDRFQLNMWGDTYQLRGANQGVICRIQINIILSRLTELRLDNYSNNINGDTLVICSEYNKYSSLGLEYIYEYGISFGSDQYCFEQDSYSSIYINGEVQTTKVLSDLELKTGDTLQVKRTYGPLFCQCQADQWEQELVTQPYILKVIDNPTVSISDILNGETIICPRDSVVLGQTVVTEEDFRWYKGANRLSTGDTSAFFTPGEYRMIEYNAPNGKCATVSNIHNIEKGVGCKGFVNGYVRENGSYNSQTGLYDNFSGVTVKTNSGLVTVSDEKGYFEFEFDSINDFTALYVADPDYYADYETVYTDNNFMLDLEEHLYTYLLETNDLAVNLNSGRNRPGFTIPYYVNIENRGKNELTTDVKVILDPNLTYSQESGGDLPSQILTNELIWGQITVASGKTKRLTFYAVLDRLTTLGSTLDNNAELIQITIDDDLTNNTVTYAPEVTGSFDPNDKLVSYIGAFTEGYVYDTTQFEYTIRFQNTGTDTAFNISVVDLMPEALDLSSLEILDASHDYIMKITGDTVTWLFRNILLPDSNVNEPASHGFIRFSINQESGNQPGTTIANKAEIYFDFNDPIITNEVVSVVNNDIVTGFKTNTKVVSNNELEVYPTPANNSINITQDGSVVIYDQLGSRVLTSIKNKNIDISSLSSGVYFIQVTTATEQLSGSFIKQ